MYDRLLTAVANEVWAIDRTKGRAILAFLAFAATGRKLSAEERAEKIGPSEARNIRERHGAIAVVPLHGIMSQFGGTLMETSEPMASTARVGAAIDKAVADDGVKAIVLHIDSPGGGIYGVRELAAKVRAARDVKPVIAQVDSVAASAAYWVATQATEVVVTLGGDVGSVGVYTVHEDVSGLLDAEGVKETLIYAGKYKVEANPFEPLSEQARAHLQGRVDAAYRDFVAAVASGRGATTARVESDFGQGRVISAKEALAAGMVDRIATFDDTLARYSRKPQDHSRRATAALAIARS